MLSKRNLFLLLSLIICLGSYSQSKLINAGKTGKVSGTVKVEKPKPEKKETSPKPKTVIKQTDDKYKSVGYMEISGISFANTDKSGNIFDDYGSDLYAGDVKYLSPKVFYKGLANTEKEISLDLKIIKDDGTVMSGKDSPNGYTFSNTVKVESGEGKSLYLLGWGNNAATAYSPGQYKYEIWYKGNILFQKGFRIHSGKTPLVNNKLMKISNISFGNGDKNANLISGYGETLVENEVQYLQPQISYQGYVLSEQKVTLMIRIILSDGNMTKGSSSPLCFTTKSDMVIKPGNNISILMGWGNDNKTLYKSGTHIYEIWLNGDKIYETTFEVKKSRESVSNLTNPTETRQNYEYVDLGLSVLWATCNIGAENPYERGAFFSWGEVETKSVFSHDNYKYNDMNVRDIGKNISGTSYDAATQIWGNNWRIPTLKEMRELINHCTWEKTIVHGCNGYRITGKNGNSIFMPATGFDLGPGYGIIGKDACKYWTATLSDEYDFNAYCLSYNKIDDPNRSYGLCIRPIRDKK